MTVVPIRTGQNLAMDQNTFLGRLVNGGMYDFFTIILCLVAAYSVYQGAHAFLDGEVHHIMMAAVSLIIEVGVYVFMHHAYPYADREGRRRLRLGLFVAIPFILTLSTLMGVVFFGGDTAIRNSMIRVVDASAANLEISHGNLAKEAAIGVQLEALSSQFASLAKQEKEGGLTGTIGIGNVTATIQSVSSLLGQMRRAVTEGQQKVSERRREAELSLESMRKIVSAASGQSKMTTAFATALSEFNANITQMQALSARSVVSTLAARLTDISAVSTVSASGNQQLAAKQAQALEQVKLAVQSAQEAVRKLVDIKIEQQQTEMFSTGDIFASLFSNFTLSMWMAFAIALCVDFGPLLFLFFKTVTVDARRRQERQEEVQTT